MKTSAIPSVRVEPGLRTEIESLLVNGETLSSFVESSIRAAVERRRAQAEFIARGLQSMADARDGGGYVAADKLLGKLERKLAKARARLAPA